MSAHDEIPRLMWCSGCGKWLTRRAGTVSYCETAGRSIKLRKTAPAKFIRARVIKTGALVP